MSIPRIESTLERIQGWDERVCLRMVAVGLSCTLTYKLFKQGTMRPRPFQVNARMAAGASPLDQFSLPSGHTLHAVAFHTVAGAVLGASIAALSFLI